MKSMCTSFEEECTYNKVSTDQPAIELFSECIEYISHAITDWITNAIDHQGPQLLGTDAVDFHPSEQRGDIPDVVEGHLSKLTSPHGSNAAAKQYRSYVVANILPKVEALQKKISIYFEMFYLEKAQIVALSRRINQMRTEFHFKFAAMDL